jgi:hypothetical protein
MWGSVKSSIWPRAKYIWAMEKRLEKAHKIHKNSQEIPVALSSWIYLYSNIHDI